MLRYLVLSSSIIAVAIQAPIIFDKWMDQSDSPKPQTPSIDRVETTTKTARLTTGNKFKIKSSHGGHFYADTRMNNRSVKVLVDTGASMVAINETTAKKIGIRLKRSDFKYNVSTANGTTKMAEATIGEIRLGNIIIRNVRAGVARDEALSTTLLGMTFLNKLKRYEVNDGTLLLEK